jgi:hypothetical protein
MSGLCFGVRLRTSGSTGRPVRMPESEAVFSVRETAVRGTGLGSGPRSGSKDEVTPRPRNAQSVTAVAPLLVLLRWSYAQWLSSISGL